MELFLFYFFSSVIIFCSYKVITVPNTVHSVLFLVLSFCNGSGLLLLIEQEFLCLLLIVVYVGAIAVLFLFVVIILNIKEKIVSEYERIEAFQYVPYAIFFGVTFILESISIIKINFISITDFYIHKEPLYYFLFNNIDKVSNIQIFGELLYTFYFIFFLVAGFILLVSIIGAVVLTLQPKVSGSKFLLKRQFVYQQISRTSGEAVFIVK